WDAAALEEAPRLLALLAEERAAAWLWMDVGALAGPGRDLGSLVEALAWLDPARARRWEAGLALAAAVPPGLELTVDLDEGPTHAVRVRLAEGPAGAAD